MLSELAALAGAAPARDPATSATAAAAKARDFFMESMCFPLSDTLTVTQRRVG